MAETTLTVKVVPTILTRDEVWQHISDTIWCESDLSTETANAIASSVLSRLHVVPVHVNEVLTQFLDWYDPEARHSDRLEAAVEDFLREVG